MTSGFEFSASTGGTHGRAAVPSGASTCMHDGAPTVLGRPAPGRRRGNTRAVANVKGRIAAALRSADAATAVIQSGRQCNGQCR